MFKYNREGDNVKIKKFTFKKYETFKQENPFT